MCRSHVRLPKINTLHSHTLTQPPPSRLLTSGSFNPRLHCIALHAHEVFMECSRISIHIRPIYKHQCARSETDAPNVGVRLRPPSEHSHPPPDCQTTTQLCPYAPAEPQTHIKMCGVVHLGASYSLTAPEARQHIRRSSSLPRV